MFITGQTILLEGRYTLPVLVLVRPCPRATMRTDVWAGLQRLYIYLECSPDVMGKPQPGIWPPFQCARATMRTDVWSGLTRLEECSPDVIMLKY